METEDSADVNRDFICFLCNGKVTLLGMVTLEQKIIQLSTCYGQVLETFPYSALESVYEEEPITDDTLILNLGYRQIYVSSLLRKDKLVKFFKSLKLYRQDIRLPASAFGFYRYQASANEQPLNVQEGRRPLMQHRQDTQQPYSNSNFSDSHIEKPFFERQRQTVRLPSVENQVRSTVLNARRDQPPTTSVSRDINLQKLQAMFPDHPVDTLKQILLDANCDVDKAVTAIVTPTNNFNL